MSEEDRLDPAQTLRIIDKSDISNRRGRWGDLNANLEHLLSEQIGTSEAIEIKFNSSEERDSALGAVRMYFRREYGASAITTQKGKRPNHPYLVYVARGKNWPDGTGA